MSLTDIFMRKQGITEKLGITLSHAFWYTRNFEIFGTHYFGRIFSLSKSIGNVIS